MNIKKTVSLFLSAVMLSFSLLSCGKKNSESVMKIAGYDVPMDIYRCIVITTRENIENEYGDDVWKSSSAEKATSELQEGIRNNLIELYTVCALGADCGITPDDGYIQSQMTITKQDYIDELGGKNEFKEELKNTHMSESAFEFILTNSIMIDEIYDHVAHSDEKYDDEDCLRELFAGDEFIRVKQILIGGEYSAGEKKDLEKAQEIYSKLKNGADFDKLSQDYNNDLLMFSNDDGYYITRGSRDRAFEEAAFALDVGEISEIVKTDAGYSIIKRYEKSDEYIDTHLKELANEYYEALYTALYEEKREEVTASVDELPKSIDIMTLD